MALPNDINARKYYRVALQRLDEARIILNAGLPAAAIYLVGYSVECILKAVLIVNTPANGRDALLQSLKDDFGHNIRRLQAGLVQRGINVPRAVSRELAYLLSWSPEIRYEPGPGDPQEAERFISAAQAVFKWSDGRI